MVGMPGEIEHEASRLHPSRVRSFNPPRRGVQATADWAHLYLILVLAEGEEVVLLLALHAALLVGGAPHAVPACAPGCGDQARANKPGMGVYCNS